MSDARVPSGPHGSFLRKWQVDDTAQALRPEIAVGVDGLVYVAPGMTGGAPIRVFTPDGCSVKATAAIRVM